MAHNTPGKPRIAGVAVATTRTRVAGELRARGACTPITQKNAVAKMQSRGKLSRCESQDG